MATIAKGRGAVWTANIPVVKPNAPAPTPVITSPILTVTNSTPSPVVTSPILPAQVITPTLPVAPVVGSPEYTAKMNAFFSDQKKVFESMTPAQAKTYGDMFGIKEADMKIAPAPIDTKTNLPINLNASSDPKSAVVGYNANYFPNMTAEATERLKVALTQNEAAIAKDEQAKKDAMFAEYKAATEATLAQKMQELADKAEIDRIAMQNTMNANFISAQQTARQLQTSNPYIIKAVSEAQQIQEDLNRADNNLQPKYSKASDNTMLYVGGGLLLLLALIK